jgi:hypothetical protein
LAAATGESFEGAAAMTSQPGMSAPGSTPFKPLVRQTFQNSRSIRCVQRSAACVQLVNMGPKRLQESAGQQYLLDSSMAGSTRASKGAGLKLYMSATPLASTSATGMSSSKQQHMTTTV